MPRERDRGGEHDEEGGDDAADAAGVEVGDGECAGGDSRDDDAADEVSGDDEEDVDADVAAGEVRDAEMRGEDEEDGEGAEAVDVGAVVGPGGAFVVLHDVQ